MKLADKFVSKSVLSKLNTMGFGNIMGQNPQWKIVPAVSSAGKSSYKVVATCSIYINDQRFHSTLRLMGFDVEKTPFTYANDTSTSTFTFALDIGDLRARVKQAIQMQECQKMLQMDNLPAAMKQAQSAGISPLQLCQGMIQMCDGASALKLIKANNFNFEQISPALLSILNDETLSFSDKKINFKCVDELAECMTYEDGLTLMRKMSTKPAIDKVNELIVGKQKEKHKQTKQSCLHVLLALRRLDEQKDIKLPKELVTAPKGCPGVMNAMLEEAKKAGDVYAEQVRFFNSPTEPELVVENSNDNSTQCQI